MEPGAFESSEALKAEGLEVAISESIDPANAAAVMRQYAEEGYDLIVAHSFGYQDAVFQVAEEFPDVNFAWAGGIGGTSENVADYDQPFYEGAYLVGLIAAELSKTGKLGALYGFDIPVCNAMGEAMLAGAQQVRPDAGGRRCRRLALERTNGPIAFEAGRKPDHLHPDAELYRHSDGAVHSTRAAA